MAVGGMTDALIMTGAALAPGEGGGGGGNHDEQSEMRDPKRDGMTENAPETIRGTGVTGPARQTGPRGGGAYNIVKAGPVRTEAPPFPLASPGLAPIRTAAERQGEYGFGPMWAGQAARLGQPLPAAELTRKLAADALVILDRGA